MLNVQQRLVTRHSLADLRARMAAIADRANAVELSLAGVVDPHWTKVAVEVCRLFDSADTAVTDAEIAADSGRPKQALNRLEAARTELTLAGNILYNFEAAQGEAVVDG